MRGERCRSLDTHIALWLDAGSDRLKPSTAQSESTTVARRRQHLSERHIRLGKSRFSSTADGLRSIFPSSVGSNASSPGPALRPFRSTTMRAARAPTSSTPSVIAIPQTGFCRRSHRDPLSFVTYDRRITKVREGACRRHGFAAVG